jgi:hypothetical protein
MASSDPVTTTTLEEANEHGYLGAVPDDTPNEAYTVEGVIAAAKDAAKDTKTSVESDKPSGSSGSKAKSSS